MVYLNYKCPLCNQILYVKDADLEYDNCSITKNKILVRFYSRKTHDCIANIGDIEQTIMYPFCSISKYRLPFSEEFK